MPASRLAVFFLVSRSAAIFFGGGGCCGCGNSCEPAPARSCPCPPPPPPPTCACQAVVPPSPYGFSAAVPVAAIPGIPPGLNYAVPPPPPLPLPPPPTLVAPPVLPGPISPPLPTNTYSGASVTSSFHQERVPASSFSDEPVPISIERPAQQPRSDSFVPPARRVTKPGLTFKNKADAEDYEILSSSGFRRKPQKRKTINKNPKCVNEQLGRIILKSIKETLSATAAREAISTAAKEMFGYNFDVICAEKPFTFTVNSDLFCELNVNETFCLAFQH